MTYNKPSFEKVASFKNSTMGLWTGKWTDIFGGRAIFRVEIGLKWCLKMKLKSAAFSETSVAENASFQLYKKRGEKNDIQ